jgi:hypothetical protein
LKELLEPQYLALLDSLDPGADPMAIRKQLDSAIPADVARALTEQNSLRARAGGKFTRTHGVLLTAKGVEQATPLGVARRRARRIHELWKQGATGDIVLDATAGLGADAIALAEAGLPLVAAEADPLIAQFLAQNLRAHGYPDRVVIARLQDGAASAPYLLADPDRRRPDGRRVGHPEAWSPPLSLVLQAAGKCRGAVIKLAPAMEVAALEAQAQEMGPACLEWVSWKGELKEVALWTGQLVDAPAPGWRRAVALREGQEEQVFAAGPDELRLSRPSLTAEEARQVRWISEPGAAVLRAGLVGAMATRTGTNPIGPGIAYLGAEECPSSPLLTNFRVLGTAKADPKRVRALLGEHEIGPITVKRRGHPLNADELARRFRGPGKKHGLVVFARLEQGHQAWLVDRESEAQQSSQTLGQTPPEVDEDLR